MYKIGIVTGQFGVDVASQELFEAASRVANARVVDPIQFSAELNNRHTIKVGSVEATDFNALIIRGLDFSGETDFQFEVFEQLDRAGIIIINSPAALQIAESKFLTSFILQEKGFTIPPSVIVQELDDAEAFLGEYEDIIAKPLYGFQGYGVIRIRRSEVDARSRIKWLLDEFKGICLQKYIPNPGRDIRAFVVGDQVVASIYRIARIGRWKTNIRAGARPIVCRLTTEQHDISIRASQGLGLDYTGVDIIEGPDGNYVLEVNGAPAWGGVMEATGRNIAQDIINYAIYRLDSGIS
ncbi:MAG: RimK family alpha-L-glutamate ligase [Actinobacteria bacterium]|nr:RimK family alpha-L-glutamate ligase [Actinomycetota bacterium]